jgi:hypothetical protein
MNSEICPGVSMDQMGLLTPDRQAALRQLAGGLPHATFSIDGPETLGGSLVVIRTDERSMAVPWTDVLDVGARYVALALRERGGWRRI